ncbi:MAG: type VI secretion system protein TssA [Algicola sp.]|nr:type VI secretion system protein TssA [Algicola sp.]
MRLITAEQSPDDYISHYLGYSLSELLAPIGDNQVGESVRHNGVYFNIKEARESDDPTLPQGVWTHELKTADWHQVKLLTLNALAEKSKDLQLGVWLFEANIHLNGFAGIAPSALLIQQLCEQYWPTMHPQMLDNDIEYRTNPLNWLNDKLTSVLRLTPITLARLDGKDYCWNDWETGQHYEKLKNQQQVDTRWDGPTPKDFKQRLNATAPDDLLAWLWQIEDALQALGLLQDWLDNCCANDSPSLMDMTGILGKISDMLSSELQSRGVSLSSVSADEQLMTERGEGGDEDPSTEEGADNMSSGGGSGNGPIKDRQEAFARLKQVIAFLKADDPHSPVPYLLETAQTWGEKSAPDLYQELFLLKGGQLNVFEMMGLEVDDSK